MMNVLSLLFFLLVINGSVVNRPVEAQESKRIVATLGQSVNLTCVTLSKQKAVWYHDEVPLSDDAGRLTTTQDTLTIMNTKLRDSGRYTCIDPAQTQTVLFSRDYSLVLEQPPAIVIALAGINAPAVVGAKVIFGCVSEGSPPPPPIEWQFNNTGDITTLQPSVNGSTSFVDIITTKPGTFEVTCMITPSMGNATSKTVSFLVTDEALTVPVAEKDFNDTIANNDKPTTFRCLLSPVTNTTTIQWVQDGQLLSGENSNELTLNRSETGVYCCEVNGSTVRCAYIYIQSHPRINTISSNISTVSGRSVSLYCESNAEEPAIVSWLYGNGTKVVNSSDTWIHDNTVGSSHLTVANVQAENERLEFMCEAVNSIGFDMRNITITTVGSCDNNMLTNPGNSSESNWNLPSPQNFIPVDEFGESVFQISYVDLMGRSETITHSVQVNSSVEALHFRAQIRQNDSEVAPHVCLTVNRITSQCAGNVLDDQTNGWQWVEGTLNFTALGISDSDLMGNTVQVELYADRTGASSPSSGEVFFDNICVEALFTPIIVVAPSEDDDSDDDNTTIIIIGAAAGGGALLLLLLILHILCCCVCCRKNKVKTVRFRKQSVETIRRNATQRPDVKTTNPIQYRPASKNTDSTDYGYNYVTPNKLGSDDENYDELKGQYVKLDGTQNNQQNEYQSTSTNGSDAENHTTELYASINEPEQPQYEILPGEADETAQYLTVVHNDDDKEDDEEEIQYLDVLPAEEEEIYSDISDSVKQQALENNDQELEIYV